MDYVDLIFALAMILVFSGVAWFATNFLTKWKDDAVREGGVSFDHAGNVLRQQEPRAVTWEEFNALKERVNKLEAWACQDRIDDQQVWESIKILDLKVGARFRIKRVETTLYFDNRAPKVTVGLSGCYTWQDGMKEIKKITFDNPHLGLAKVQRDGNPAWVSTIPVCSNSENRWLVSYELEEITL